MPSLSRSDSLLEDLREGKSFSFAHQVELTLRLAMPAILAQVSSIVMEYIDASMVGHLGANASASIGLVSTTTWLFGGVSRAFTMGFTVQVAQQIGARREAQARSIMRQGLVVTLSLSLVMVVVALLIGGSLPGWLSSDVAIHADASRYFIIFMMAMPAFVMNAFAGGALQASGDMKTPGILNSASCFLDVLFNALMIYPTGTFGVGSVALWGAGLGVAGAALGTLLSIYVTAAAMLFVLLVRSRPMHLRRDEKLVWQAPHLKMAARLAMPIAVEQILMCGAHIASTAIVAPLGSVAISAHSFAITVESLCYMPGFGIAQAATTLIGQCIGAGRRLLTRHLSRICVGVGMVTMTATGILMYVFAPQMIGFLSPVEEIQTLGTTILRIEAFAEPLYGASIVANGVFRGAGDTLVPSIMNFMSIWIIRLPAAWFLTYTMGLGLEGVWIAMACELSARGIVFLARLFGRRWMKKVC